MTRISDDELRIRLSRLDPAPAGRSVDPVTSARARDLVERTTLTHEARTPSPTTRRRRPWLPAAAAALVLVALVGTVLALSGGGLVGDAPRGEDPTTRALELPPSDVAGSCVVFDVQILADMPVALAGTVTAIGAEWVTLDVDRWYRGATPMR